MNEKIGFIGCGNMARAMIAGLMNSKTSAPDRIMASNRTDCKLENVKKDFNVKTTTDNGEVAQFADILVLSVKPDKYRSVINEIKDCIKDETVIVTIAAGIKIKTVEAYFGRRVKIVRTMPNMSAVVGEAMTAICRNDLVSEKELNAVEDVFKSFGEVEMINENLFDVVTAVSGSSPALVYMFIEALADGAVLKGLSRDKAYRMASQAVLGAAKMVLATGQHPGILKDSVCSPGGTTIEAVYSLEKGGFRGNIIEAVQRCAEKAEFLGTETKDSLGQ